MGSGEIEARDVAASVAQDADQLTLVGDARTQPTDGVGVDVTGDGNLPPGRTGIFLPEGVKKIKTSWVLSQLLTTWGINCKSWRPCDDDRKPKVFPSSRVTSEPKL